MAQNRKKGMAKRALSVSLVAAMLATSNTPAWASGFMNENEDGVQAFFNEISEEVATKEDVIVNAAANEEGNYETSSVEAVKTAVGNANIEWDNLDKLKEIKTAAAGVKLGATVAGKVSAEFGFINLGSVDSEGELSVDGEFKVWNGELNTAAGSKAYIGKAVAVKLTRKDLAGNTYEHYITAAGAEIAAVNAATVEDYSITVNEKVIKKADAAKSIPYEKNGYTIDSVSLTLKNKEIITINHPEKETGVTSVTVPTGDGNAKDKTGSFKITFADGNPWGFDTTGGKEFEVTGVKITGSDLKDLVSLKSASLTYRPVLDDMKAAALKIVNSDNLTTTDFALEFYKDVDAKVKWTANDDVALGTAYLAVEPAVGGAIENYEKAVFEVKIAAKDLSTLVPDEEFVKSLVYNATFNTDLQTNIAKMFFYEAGDGAVYDVTNDGKLDVDYPASVKAGEAVTVKVRAKQGFSSFYTGEKVYTFTPDAGTLPATVDDLSDALENLALVYDGQYHAVSNLLKGGKVGNLEATDYTLSSPDSSVVNGSIKDAGTYNIVLTATKAPYAGKTLKATVEIKKADLGVFASGKGTSIASDFYYTAGMNKDDADLKDKVKPVLSFNGTTLVEGVDYVLDEKGVYLGSGSGVAAVKNGINMDIKPASGKCNFELAGAATNQTVVLGTLKARPLSTLNFPEIPTQQYAADLVDVSKIMTVLEGEKDGAKVKYSTLLLDGTTALSASDDYTVVLTAPKNGEGTAELVFKGKENYTGTVTKTFEITKKAINASFYHSLQGKNVLGVPSITYNYTKATAGTLKHADDEVFVVGDDGNSYTEGTDYKLVYTENTKAGTAKVEAIGINNTIYAVSQFKILPKQVTKNATSVGNDEIFGVVVAAKVAIHGYTGEEIKPEIQFEKSDAPNNAIKLTDGNYTLKEGVDYQISYKENVKAGATNDAGSAKIVVTGLGNYVFNEKDAADNEDNSGINATFSINKAVIGTTNMVVKNVVYAGGLEVTPDITLMNPNSNKILEVGKDYTIKLTNGVNAGVATATLELTKEMADNYVITAIKTVTFQILKKNLSECSATVVDGKVVVKNGEITVPETEYTATENEDGSFTVKAAEKNYTGTVTVSPVVAPAATQAKVTAKTTSSVTVSWDAVEGAEGYTIWYHSEKDTKNARKVITGGDVTSWTQKGLAAGTKYFYTVKAWVKDAEGKYVFGEETSYVRGTTMPMKAKIAKVTAANGMVKVALADKAAGAEKYSMCYSKSSDFASFKVGVRTSYTTRTFTNALTKGTYYVRVKSYRDLGNNKRIYGAWSNTVKVVVK